LDDSERIKHSRGRFIGRFGAIGQIFQINGGCGIGIPIETRQRGGVQVSINSEGDVLTGTP
jgi:hypothetical protein